MQIDFYGYSALGNRVENEDSYSCDRLSDTRMYAIVADGLGGHGGGRIASKTAVDTLLQCRNEQGLPTPEKIGAWMEQANQEILRRRSGPNHMKTTVVSLFVNGNTAIWAHIGDSRLYHFFNGRLVDYTNDHSVCQLAVRMGEISRKQIQGHPDRSKLLKVLGDNSITPEIHPPVELKPGHHAFLLCSDGLWERLQEDEIMLDLHKSATPEQWIYYLRCRGIMRKSTDVDNNTAIAVFIKE